MKVDLHVHTTASDGKIKPEEIIERAREKGLDCIAVTDHDTMDGYRKAKETVPDDGFLLIPGIEVSTEKGHILVLGTEKEPKTKDFEELLEFAEENNAITVGAHPFARVKDEIEPKYLKRLDAIEIINGRTYPKANKKAEKFAIENSMPKTAGSDSHMEDELGGVWNEVEGDTVEEIIGKVKNGEAEPKGKNTSFFWVTYHKIKSNLI